MANGEWQGRGITLLLRYSLFAIRHSRSIRYSLFAIRASNMLDVQSIDLHYGAAQALRAVSLTAEPGKVTCVLGRNGVGKTSLLDALAGQHPVTRGTVSLDGADITALAPYQRARRGIAYVPQGREIFPLLTVRENLETGFAPLSREQGAIPDCVFALFPAASNSNSPSVARSSCGRACCSSTSRPRASSRRSSKTSAERLPICATSARSRSCWSSNISTSRANSATILPSWTAAPSSTPAAGPTWTRRRSNARWRCDMGLAEDHARVFAANRAVGRIALTAEYGRGITQRKRMHESGGLRMHFPGARARELEAVLINTAGGIVGGDRIDLDIAAGEKARLL